MDLLKFVVYLCCLKIHFCCCLLRGPEHDGSKGFQAAR